MSILFTVIVFIVIFSILILVHEWGHFIMAKRAGIKVEEFGLGLPPRIWGKKKGETIYSINWIPFGGFVRLYGEDSSDPKMLRSKRSFVGKSMRARVKVIVAGVLMNFLLAWFLMVIGFISGMQPLLTPNDVLPAIKNNQIIIEPGIKVRNVEEMSISEEKGVQIGDRLEMINGEKVNEFVMTQIQEDPVATYTFSRNDEFYNIQFTRLELSESEIQGTGIDFYDFALFPHIKIYNVEENTKSYQAGLRPNDVILKVNDIYVFNILEYEDIVRGENFLEYQVYRDGEIFDVLVERNDSRQIVISKIVPDSPADEVGFRSGDVILSVNAREIIDSQKLIDFVYENKEEILVYSIRRNGEDIFLRVQPDETGKIGVYLSELMSYTFDFGLVLYNTDMLSSVIEIKEVQYPFYIASYKSFGEIYRLSKLTGRMFVGFVGNLLTSGEVPTSVAGPVGIAHMTHVFVQEGLIPILRFTAILSLSLAVINILPIPALDGGRLLFVFIEFVIGKRVPNKWERWIHAFGYLLILLLIFSVTYSDIMRLITK